MQIPRLPVTGENLKKYILDTLKAILDYLKATKIRAGYGIAVDETPSGTIVRLAKVASSGASGTGTSEAEISGGLGIVVSGGTGGNPYVIKSNIKAGFAISLTGGSGGSPYVVGLNVQAGSNITLSGGTNGNPLIISSTGGGGGGGIPFPDYAALTTSSSSGTVLTNGSPFTATSNGWLRVSIRNDGGLSDGCFRLSLDGADIGFYQYRTNSPGVTKFIYIPSGTVVQYSSPSSSSFVKFAPGIGGGLPAPIYSAMTGSGSLSTGTTYTAPADGWLRISIRNDGNLSDGCFRLYIDESSIGFYQYRTGSCGITDFIPLKSGTEFRFETSSTSYYVKFDHAIS